MISTDPSTLKPSLKPVFFASEIRAIIGRTALMQIKLFLFFSYRRSWTSPRRKRLRHKKIRQVGFGQQIDKVGRPDRLALQPSPETSVSHSNPGLSPWRWSHVLRRRIIDYPLRPLRTADVTTNIWEAFKYSPRGVSSTVSPPSTSSSAPTILGTVVAWDVSNIFWTYTAKITIPTKKTSANHFDSPMLNAVNHQTSFIELLGI